MSKKNKRIKRKYRLQKIILAAVMFVSAAAGIFMINAPAMARQPYVENKYELLESLTWFLAGRDGEGEAPPLSEMERELSLTGIGVLTIGRIDLRLPLIEGVRYETLNVAPGWVPETATIGQMGNAVIAGHRNYTFGEMFNRLGELVIGDIIGIQTIDGYKEFEVFEKAVIEPTDQIAFVQPVNDSIITLFTCTPIEISSHRLIIRAMSTL